MFAIAEHETGGHHSLLLKTIFKFLKKSLGLHYNRLLLFSILHQVVKPMDENDTCH